MTDAADSSVLFNLRQLMKLEEERVAGEADALRLAREAADAEAQAVVEAAECRAQSEREALQRATVEREAALLRVQLEAAAAERAREQRLNEAHARELASLQADAARRRAGALRRVGVVFAVAAALAGAGQWVALERTDRARGAAQAALTLTAAQARELADLRARLSSAQAEAAQWAATREQPTAATAPQVPQRVDRAPRLVAVERTPVERHSTRVHTKQAAPDLDLNEDDRDPIEGL